MENASKALILAGTILISILLISLGISLLNSSSEITEEAGNRSKSMAVSMFNSRFTQYFGNSVPGSRVKSLITTVMNHNISTTNPSSRDEEKININLSVRGKTPPAGSSYYTGGHQYKATNLQVLMDAVSPASTFTVRPTARCGDANVEGGYNTNTGRIHCITITEN